MKLLKVLMVTIFICTFFKSADLALAENIYTDSSAVLKSHINHSFDTRALRLKTYFQTHASPLENYAINFVENADKYNLDWRFVPAITGVESTFAKRIPYNSFNAYGWANGNYYFDSWPQSIEHVSKTLKEKYVDDGLTTVNQIARRYAPPSSTWAWKVNFFMNDIDNFPLEFTI